eukprot:2601820-Amphidinium_carterae.1
MSLSSSGAARMEHRNTLQHRWSNSRSLFLKSVIQKPIARLRCCRELMFHEAADSRTEESSWRKISGNIRIENLDFAFACVTLRSAEAMPL